MNILLQYGLFLYLRKTIAERHDENWGYIVSHKFGSFGSDVGTNASPPEVHRNLKPNLVIKNEVFQVLSPRHKKRSPEGVKSRI